MTRTPRSSQIAKRRRGERQGMALILVLGLIAMTLGVSYAMVRAQTAGVRVSTNGQLMNDARQAALSGLSAGMRRISQTSWGGVDTTITGTISATESYDVTFVTGDTALTTTAADAADWPFRVTLTATGYAVDPTASSVVTTYKVEAVAELVPKQLTANPTMWTTFMNYVFYQTHTDNLNVQLPLQIKGPQRWNGGLVNFLSSYPTTTSQRQKYLGDLNAMRTNGYADCRPFTGPITLLNGSTSSTNRQLMSNQLGITLTNASSVSTTSWSHPGSVTTYNLYPGGQSYTVPTLNSTVTNTTYQPDPRTNPAGIYYRNGDVTLGNNATVVGTIISTGNVTLAGTGVSVTPFSMTPITGTTVSPQFPVIVASSQVRISPGADATVRGVVAAFDAFVSTAGTQATRLDMQGTLIARNVDVQDRSEWDFGSLWWGLLYSAFNGQSSTNYFPVYAQAAANLQYTPLLTISAQTGSFTRQWFTAGSPVYAVGSGDAGLKWSVLRITELR